MLIIYLTELSDRYTMLLKRNMSIDVMFIYLMLSLLLSAAPIFSQSIVYDDYLRWESSLYIDDYRYLSLYERTVERIEPSVHRGRELLSSYHMMSESERSEYINHLIRLERQRKCAYAAVAVSLLAVSVIVAYKSDFPKNISIALFVNKVLG